MQRHEHDARRPADEPAESPNAESPSAASTSAESVTAEIDYLAGCQDPTDQRALDTLDEMRARYRHDEATADAIGMAYHRLRGGDMSAFHRHVGDLRRRLCDRSAAGRATPPASRGAE